MEKWGSVRRHESCEIEWQKPVNGKEATMPKEEIKKGKRKGEKKRTRECALAFEEEGEEKKKSRGEPGAAEGEEDDGIPLGSRVFLSVRRLGWLRIP